jgi:hypothetical protein
MEHAHFTIKPRPFGVPSVTALKSFLVAENGKSAVKATYVHILDNFICMIPHTRTPMQARARAETVIHCAQLAGHW